MQGETSPRIWPVGCAILLIAGLCAKQIELGQFIPGGSSGLQGRDRVVIFDRTNACVIAIPANASPAEHRAAELIQEVLAKSSGRSTLDFPIIQQNSGGSTLKRSRPTTITVAGLNHRAAGNAKIFERVNLRVVPGRVEVSSYPADAIEAASAWFLATTVGAAWFSPTKLGEHIPQLTELRLTVGERSHEPSFVSRMFWLRGGAEESAWIRYNRLRSSLAHGHAMSGFFSRKALIANPELASSINGRKYIPTGADDGNWQPNIANSQAVDHAAVVVASRADISVAFGMNDSIRFDQSEETKRLVEPLAWFRKKPDYSRFVFGFVNEVARRVPEKYLGAYAYDWTENTPGFPIEPNVVPYLTADRSEWFDRDFERGDQELIRRWVASGAKIVGLYDYFEGAPFIVPRPTLYAVSRSIPFAYRAGVKAYYAEFNSNWALDGPKAWLTAQLLWDGDAKPEDLLEIYYREYWAEAAGPMRQFFASCDQQWLSQPKPGYWLKYFKDEHQHLLFPASVRERLKNLLDAARSAATTELTRKRVEFTAGAFAVSDAFCAWEEAKESLSRLALATVPDSTAIQAAWRELDAREQAMKAVHARVTKATPLAIKATILGEYERNDPRMRAAWRVRSSGLKSPVSGRAPTGSELLRDASLVESRIKPPETSFDLEWVEAGPWRGHGEPFETRSVSMGRPEPENPKPEVLGTQAGQAVSHSAQVSASLVMRGCKQETFSQMVGAEPGQTYLARVTVRGKVSPGNMTFLILNFQDAEGKALGLGVVDRLPVGDYGDGVELVVWAAAPKAAKWVGMGVRALNQVEDDFAAFSGFSLQALKR